MICSLNLFPHDFFSMYNFVFGLRRPDIKIKGGLRAGIKAVV